MESWRGFAEVSPFSGGLSIFLTQLGADLVVFLAIAGFFFLIFYVLLPQAFSHRKVQEALPGSSDLRREILLSVQSVAIFAAFSVIFLGLYRLGWSKLYLNISDYGWPYFILSIFLVIALQDTWFYWSHRLLHWGPLFKRIHYVHHRSHNPTPWAAFAFHPVEAAINAIVVPLATIFVPLNIWAEEIWFFYMFFMSVYVHLGYEIMPRGYPKHWAFRWTISAMHHNMHHEHGRANFGFYFTIWDVLMHTTHADYEERFDEITQAAKVSKRTFRRRQRFPAAPKRVPASQTRS